MSAVRVDDMTQKMQNYLLEFEPAHARLLLWVLRQVALGHPLTPDQVERHIAELGIAPGTAQHSLRELTERDARGQIVGAMGLSLALNDHPHQLLINGVSCTAWCAMDTFFLPILLQQTVIIESPSPVTQNLIRLRVSPERVEEVSPASAVVSQVILEPRREHLTTVEAVLSAFCQHIHFFTNHDEAAQWASGRRDRENIAILTVDEGFALERQVMAKVFPDLSAA
jgi:alkylmercury lyase